MKKRPTVVSELRELQAQYGVSQSKMAALLKMTRGHYSEVLAGKRRLSYRAACHAYNLGAEAGVLLDLALFEKLPS